MKKYVTMIVIVTAALFASTATVRAESPPPFLFKFGTLCTISTLSGCVDPDAGGPLVVGDGQLDDPFGLTVDDAGYIFVADRDNNRIQKFSPSGAFMFKFGSTGSTDGRFNLPFDVEVDDSGSIYVADRNNNRIQKFSPSGAFLLKFGTRCNLATGGDCVDPDGAGPLELGDGEFLSPSGIAVDDSGNVFVADTSNNRIQKFSPSGAFLLKFGTRCSISSGSDCVDPDGAGPLALGDGEFNLPIGIGADDSGNVFVADTSNHRIQKFNTSGAFLLKFGVNGTTDGRFRNPSDVEVDNAGGIHVVDRDNDRIQKFDASGAFLYKLGTLGSGNGQFSDPTGVASHASGKTYVADSDNHRVQVFGIATPEPINNRLGVGGISQSYDPDDTHGGQFPLGVFSFDVTYTNTSDRAIKDVHVQVSALTGGAGEVIGIGGVGDPPVKVEPPLVDPGAPALADDMLGVGEQITVHYNVGLVADGPFTFTIAGTGILHYQ